MFSFFLQEYGQCPDEQLPDEHPCEAQGGSNEGPPTDALKVEKSFSTFLEPQVGHSGLVWLLGTSFSNALRHFLQLYS
ncbi:MAG: hypothetical protein A2X46_13120 [Lentisphaerae bacterium GWF2_57_35]|nr:MAG: hypothetical protein A2X46_13120 [Lentisphaerae bacterium GWF2_57_35]